MNDTNRRRLKLLLKIGALIDQLDDVLCEAEFSADGDNFGSPTPGRPRAIFAPPAPPYRELRGYAVDPSFATKLDAVGISEVTYRLPWETLEPGPVGEYLEVMDIDPASNCVYEPVNLDEPALLAQDGLPPNESTPQFHQQMVYAVCSLTIHNFERALGRKVLWRPGPPAPGQNAKDDSHYIQRLRVYPHSMREANAFYSPRKVALLFGYFNASKDDPGNHMPGGRVFTCLSHDIVAHETTHAILDGMHRQFLLPSNRDVLAFHEGFADCVAMLQHFTFPDLVAHQIANTRGEIDAQENLLVQLASEFGKATGNRTALRDAIGRPKDVQGKGKVWMRHEPDPREYETIEEPHMRGQILVAAVFDALLSIYKIRTADLQRLATGGTGVLRPGAIPPDLINRLAREASKSAEHVLSMCIRALDYCPPTDITFGEYLRAIITADYDLVSDDDLNYRVSFIEAFRQRGIYPLDVRTLSVPSLLWRSVEKSDYKPSQTLNEFLNELRDPGQGHIYAQSREEIFRLQRSMRLRLHSQLSHHFKNSPAGKRDAEFLGLDAEKSFEVHTARIAYRSSPDGGVAPQLLVGLLQSTTHPVDPREPRGPRMKFEGGCTLVFDLRAQAVRYCVRKSLKSNSRVARQQAFSVKEFDSLHSTYLGVHRMAESSSPFGNEPFALIHRGT